MQLVLYHRRRSLVIVRDHVQKNFPAVICNRERKSTGLKVTGPPSLFTHGGCTDEIAAQRSPNVRAIYYANVTICSSFNFFSVQVFIPNKKNKLRDSRENHIRTMRYMTFHQSHHWPVSWLFLPISPPFPWLPVLLLKPTDTTHTTLKF